jgi:regulator of cell morphogenesis and NO signaling
MTIHASESLGSIVARFPQAAKVLTRYHIDYCCGGERSLAAACDERSLDVDAVLSSIADAIEATPGVHTDWQTADLSDLIEHIESTHHVFLRDTLPQLSQLTEKIMRVHGTRHTELIELFSLVAKLRSDLELHLFQEETDSFPKIRRYLERKDVRSHDTALRSIRGREDEHEEAGRLLHQIEALTNHFEVPDDACGTYRITYELLHDLVHDTFTHVHLENNILFTRILLDGPSR